MQKTFNQKIMFGCSSCGLEDIVDYKKNTDEAYLDFLTRFDDGKVLTKKKMQTALEQEGIVQSENEIRKMIGDAKLDDLTSSILFSRKHFVSHFRTLSEPEPNMGSKVMEVGLDENITKVLEEKGIERFYKFQEDAILEIMRGNNVVITAPTASGKTEAFVVPIIQKILDENSKGRVLALFVYPTKSLSKDQLPKIKEIADRLGIGVSVFDGDTKTSDRQKIFENPPQIIITNFDVVHYHLWHRSKFATLLNTIKFLVVDEAHVYSGIFGSNVHYIIKRLKRICQKLQIISSSATLDNALPFCEQLFCVQMKLVSGSGKKGKTDFSMLFPSLRTQRALMVDIVKSLTSKKHKTLVFSNSHLNSELLAMQARRQKVDIKVHRAGLMANYRKSVENAFKNDTLMAISATPTLELGIDVGDVDGVISSTIPVNRLVQRIGRAARKGQNGYAFLVLGNDPISQYY
ncbi:MAG: DEAD/DEAH box helicase, partial [Nitrosopumilaceae archaeon]